MHAARSIILLEFNELTPSLMDRFIDEGKLPAFKELRASSRVYVTTTDEERLDPWIQWVTVHTGVPYGEHKIAELGEGSRFKGPRIWDVVSNAGMPVWICGSMNIHHQANLKGAVLPDPWCGVSTLPRPPELGAYFDFVRRQVQEHTNRDVRPSIIEALGFGTFMATHGLSMDTVGAAGKQWLSERAGKFRWRRASLLDSIQWDLFRHYHDKIQPRLSTFFLNSTAHFQHLYWRDMEPEGFALTGAPTAQRGEHEEAILFGYQRMDRLVEKALALSGNDTVLVFSTALSQEPHLLHEASGGKRFYRPRDFTVMLGELGLPPQCRVAPVMAEQFHLHFASIEEARTGASRLGKYHVGGEKLFALRRTGKSVLAGCAIHHAVEESARISGGPRPLPFLRLFYRAEAVKSGRHHPDGMLWIRIPGAKAGTSSEKVPLTNIAPTLLSILGLTAPATMRGEPLPGLILSEGVAA